MNLGIFMQLLNTSHPIVMQCFCQHWECGVSTVSRIGKCVAWTRGEKRSFGGRYIPGPDFRKILRQTYDNVNDLR